MDGSKLHRSTTFPDSLNHLEKVFEVFELKLENVIALNESLVKRNNELSRTITELEISWMKTKDKKISVQLKVSN